MALAILILFIPFFCWRFIYYGYPLPNTFYAKVGFASDQVIRGLKYLFLFIIPATAILIPLIDPPAVFGWIRRNRDLFILPVICAVFGVYIVFIGGDSLPAFRFFIFIMPLICLISAISIPLFGRREATVIFMAVFAYNIIMWNFILVLPHLKTSHVAENGREAGIWLKENVPGNAVIATNTAGSIPYFSGLKTIDMLGLNDAHIAHRNIPEMGSGSAGHEKGDGEYILKCRPDLIQFGSSLGEIKPVFRSDHELFENPEFHEQYKLIRITLPSGKILSLYKRSNENIP